MACSGFHQVLCTEMVSATTTPCTSDQTISENMNSTQDAVEYSEDFVCFTNISYRMSEPATATFRESIVP